MLILRLFCRVMPDGVMALGKSLCSHALSLVEGFSIVSTRPSRPSFRTGRVKCAGIQNPPLRPQDFALTGPLPVYSDIPFSNASAFGHASENIGASESSGTSWSTANFVFPPTSVSV